MSLTAQDIQALKVEFDSKTVGVKIQSTSKNKDKAMLVLYLQHTDVYDRIEQVDPGWKFEVMTDRIGNESVSIHGRLTIKGVTRDNYGEGEDYKGACSDCLKRCAMLFGVGRYLYDSETVWVPYTEQDKYRQWTYEDYKKHTRRPVSQSAPQTKGPTIAPKSHSSPVKTKASLGKEILDAGAKLNQSPAQIKEWALEFSGKTSDKMSLPEMESFLEMLLIETGRQGAV